MQTTEQLHIQTQVLKAATSPFRALNHQLRQKILQQIHKRKRIMVTDLYCQLKIEQSVASQHLAILRHDRIVTTEKKGKYIFYSVNYQRIKELEAFAMELLKMDEPLTVKMPEQRANEKYEMPNWLLAAVKQATERGV